VSLDTRVKKLEGAGAPPVGAPPVHIYLPRKDPDPESGQPFPGARPVGIYPGPGHIFVIYDPDDPDGSVPEEYRPVHPGRPAG
jgi:hypothetical protein